MPGYYPRKGVKGYLYQRLCKRFDKSLFFLDPDTRAFDIKHWENCSCREIRDKACNELPSSAYELIESFLSLSDMPLD